MGQTRFNARLGLSVGTSPTDIIDANGAVTVPASQGISIATGAPGVTTNKLYQVGSSLYWNGSAVGSGGGSLPSQTGNGGKFLGTDGSNASWTNILTTSSSVPFLQSTRSDLSNTITFTHSASNVITLTGNLIVASDPTTNLGVATKQYVDTQDASIQPAALAAAIGTLQTYTPLWTTSGTQPSIGNGTLIGQWRRIGTNIELSIRLVIGSTTSLGTGSWYLSLPPNLSMNPSDPTPFALGFGYAYDSSPFTVRPVTVQKGNTDYTLSFVMSDGTGGGVTNISPYTWATGDELDFKCTIPISQYTSNINLITDFTEYLSCDGTGTGEGTAANTSYTPANPYRGQDGSLIPAVTISSTTATTSTAYSLTSANPPKSTDKYFLEYSANGGVSWNAIEHGSNTIAPAVNMNGVMVGMRLSVTTTGCTVSFSNAGRITGTTYGSGQGDWATVRATPYFWRWRVRKVSNGNFAQGSCAFSKTIGDGSSTTLDVTHGLQTEDVIIFVREATGLKREVDCTKRVIDANTIRLTDFIAAPATNSLKVFVGTNGGTTGVTSDTQEFLSCDGTIGIAANTSYTPTTVRTIDGSLLPAVTISSTTATTVTTYYLTCATTIKATDILTFELSMDSGATWCSIATINNAIGTTIQNNVYQGIRIYPNSNKTQINVQFSNAGRIAGTTYGSAAGDWSSGLSTWRWRIRKISNGNFSQLATDQYSISEIATNKTWTDGKPIYRKVISVGPLPNNTTKNVAHGISSMDTLVSITGAARDTTTGNTCLIPHVSTASLASCVTVYADSTNIVITTGTDRSAYNKANVIIEYTK